jgi:molybdenum cofactor cytidylyltransferase
MLLPWGETTVLGHVIHTLRSTKIEEILVITGGAREEVESLVHPPVRALFNPDYHRAEMLSSVQVGLRAASGAAVLIVLGDQPQVKINSLELIFKEFASNTSSIILPSYHMRRGHPWLLPRELWDEILRMGSGDSLRDFLDRHADEIHYVEVEDPLDTPEDYLKSRP